MIIREHAPQQPPLLNERKLEWLGTVDKQLEMSFGALEGSPNPNEFKSGLIADIKNLLEIKKLLKEG